MTIMLANDCAKLSQFTNLMSLLYLCYVCHYYGLAIIILYFLTLLLIRFILRWPYSQVMQALNLLDCWSQAKVISECFSLQTHHIDIINSNNLIPYKQYKKGTHTQNYFTLVILEFFFPTLPS